MANGNIVADYATKFETWNVNDAYRFKIANYAPDTPYNHGLIVCVKFTQV